MSIRFYPVEDYVSFFYILWLLLSLLSLKEYSIITISTLKVVTDTDTTPYYTLYSFFRTSSFPPVSSYYNEDCDSRSLSELYSPNELL